MTGARGTMPKSTKGGRCDGLANGSRVCSAGPPLRLRVSGGDEMNKQAWLILSGVVLVLIAACTAPGPDDYEAALEQQRLYEEMVCEGSWPPYDGPVNCDER